jgi:hypothetical protein
MSMRALLLLAVLTLPACGLVPGGQSSRTAAPIGQTTSPAPPAAATGASPAPRSEPPRASSPPPPSAATACRPGVRCEAIVGALEMIDARKMDDHLQALTSFVSRDPRHPGHAKAVAYIKEQLGALEHRALRVETHRTVHQGIPLENIFAVIDPQAGAATNGWVLVSAHYDSTANRTRGWRPASDPAPGADDNATGTAALLEFARVVAERRGQLGTRVVLAFFDGEELFFKGSGAYVASLAKPYPYKAAVNLDMVGFNPLADRLDLLWYTSVSAGLRDRVVRANETYGIGVAPLHAQFAADGSTIMDAAPFGIAGIPSVALCQRYGENDATFPGNYTFHTVNDTPDKITNKRLWLKAAKLTLAVALELATEAAQ